MQIIVLTKLREDSLQQIKDAFPEDTITALKRPMTQADVDQADVIIGNPPLSLDLNAAHIKAIMLNSAGNDGYTEDGVLHPDTHLTNASGSYGIAIAEHTIACILSFNKQILDHARQQQAHQWHMLTDGRELYDSNVLILGLGDIGYQLAKRLKAFGCHITGIKRRLTGSINYVDELATMDDLHKHLKEADYVINALPGTQSTYHVLDKEALLTMKKDAVVVNVGRGTAIDTEALIDVLNQGHLAAALLDVVEGEPLPSDSPLFDTPRVLITSHSAGGYHWHSVQQAIVDLMIRNINHIKNDEPLDNEVDKIAGYRKVVTYRD